MDQKICRRHKEDGHDYGNRQAADDGAGERSVLLAAGFHRECHRDEAENGGEGSHENRPQAHAAGKRHGFPNWLASLRNTRVTSTMRMLLETTIPVIMMTPIRDITFNVV